MTFDVKYVLEESEIELPYIYYTGYSVTLENNGKKVKLEAYETDKGFVGIKVPVLEQGKVEVKYTGTIIMKISSFISVVGVCILIGICRGGNLPPKNKKL